MLNQPQTLIEEELSVKPVSRGIDRVGGVTFDDETLVADRGLIVPATFDGQPRPRSPHQRQGAPRGPGRRGAPGGRLGR